MYFDSSMKLEGTGVGVLFIFPKGEQLRYVLQILWKATNNEAKYEALLHGLRLAASLSIRHLAVHRDSSVVINQVNKDWDCTKEMMDAYYAKVRKLECHFCGLEFHYMSREENIVADALSKLGSL
jgi:ribonuclease HI